jgi:2-oxoisovalerate ferredoxin oxidoreductase beta subunit
MAGDYQAPDGVRIVPIPALKIAQGKGAQQAINTAMFGALSELGDLGISRESFEKALAQSFAKKPKLVPLNLEIFKLGSEAARKEVGAKLKVAVVAR